MTTPEPLEARIKAAHEARISRKNFKTVRRLDGIDPRHHAEDHWLQDFHEGTYFGYDLAIQDVLEYCQSIKPLEGCFGIYSGEVWAEKIAERFKKEKANG